MASNYETIRQQICDKKQILKQWFEILYDMYDDLSNESFMEGWGMYNPATSSYKPKRVRDFENDIRSLQDEIYNLEKELHTEVIKQAADKAKKTILLKTNCIACNV